MNHRLTAVPPHEAVDQLERAQTRWSLIDSLLRRLASRLTYAAEGRSPRLDGTLADIRQQMREPLDEDALEPLLTRLAEAVRSLDESPASATAATAPSAPVDTSAGELLLALLDRLKLDEASSARLVTLRAAIADAPDLPALARQAEALAGMVNRHYRQLGEQRAAAERLLTHVTRQLEQLVHYLAHEGADRQDGSGARQELDHRLIGEIDALGSRMHQASDLGALQLEVQSRLGAITSHLETFRERETARERDWQIRAEQMNQRIRELELMAQTMEANLHQEHQLASTDALTGIANRLTFEQHMAAACLEVAQTGVDTCLLVLDIDRFKHINDSFGHAAGDRALRIVAEQLKARLRADDLLARYGGEEFVVVLAATSAQAGLRVAEMLRACIEGIGFRGQQQPVRITLSCGLTALRAGDTPDSAFERADRALYRAKHAGRNRCEVL
ncbi:MAG: GGDEF domain-containing protein [Xanthomonadaceae bacterium]|nr:GGDEF domain-containing protein [Xanthomonadaceae bacterium]